MCYLLHSTETWLDFLETISVKSTVYLVLCMRSICLNTLVTLVYFDFITFHRTRRSSNGQIERNKHSEAKCLLGSNMHSTHPTLNATNKVNGFLKGWHGNRMHAFLFSLYHPHTDNIECVFVSVRTLRVLSLSNTSVSLAILHVRGTMSV